MYAYEKRLKTMSYYTRSKSALDANMFTVMEDTVKEMIKVKENEEEKVDVCYKGCLTCSS